MRVFLLTLRYKVKLSTHSYTLNLNLKGLALQLMDLLKEPQLPYILNAAYHTQVACYMKYRVNQIQIRLLIGLHAAHRDGLTEVGALDLVKYSSLTLRGVHRRMFELVRLGLIDKVRRGVCSLSEKGEEFMNYYYTTVQSMRGDIPANLERLRETRPKSKKRVNNGEDTTI